VSQNALQHISSNTSISLIEDTCVGFDFCGINKLKENSVSPVPRSSVRLG